MLFQCFVFCGWWLLYFCLIRFIIMLKNWHNRLSHNDCFVKYLKTSSHPLATVQRDKHTMQPPSRWFACVICDITTVVCLLRHTEIRPGKCACVQVNGILKLQKLLVLSSSVEDYSIFSFVLFAIMHNGSRVVPDKMSIHSNWLPC